MEDSSIARAFSPLDRWLFAVARAESQHFGVCLFGFTPTSTGRRTGVSWAIQRCGDVIEKERQSSLRPSIS
jgi:hypothetical protein